MFELAVIAPPLAFFAATVATLALLRGLLHWGIRNSLAAPRISHDCAPDAFGLHFESARIDTENQRWLHGWLIAPVAGADAPCPAMIVMHGWGGNAAMMLPLARALHGAGFADDVEHALAWLAARASIELGASA